MADFNINCNLRELNNYFCQNNIELSEQDARTINTIFNECDTVDDKTNSDGKDGILNNSEWSNFVEVLKTKVPNILSSLVDFKATKETEASIDEYLSAKVKPPVDMTTNIKNEIKYREKNYPNYSDEIVEQWNKVIVEEADNYNFPAEVITAIISRESHFIDPKGQSGCMAVIPDTAKNIKRDKDNIYKNTNEECRNDLINNLKNKSLKDRNTGIKAGILVFQSKYAEVIARKKHWTTKGVYDIERVANALREGSLTFTQAEAKEIMRESLKLYNGSKHKESYAKDCIKRLDLMGYDYTTPIFAPKIED